MHHVAQDDSGTKALHTSARHNPYPRPNHFPTYVFLGKAIHYELQRAPNATHESRAYSRTLLLRI
jgi:hypothetical protein